METQLTLSSPAFANGEQIPRQYTADGANTYPPLIFGGVSSRAKSLVLIVDDPDAATDPKGSGVTYTTGLFLISHPLQLKFQKTVYQPVPCGVQTVRVSTPM